MTSRFAFQAAVMLLPLLYVPGFGNWVREPKLVALFFVAGVFSLRRSSQAVVVSPLTRWVVIAVAGFIGLQVLSGLHVPNRGQWLTSLAVSAAAVLLAASTFRSELKLHNLSDAVALTSLALVSVASVELLAGVSLFSRPLFWGLPIGGRNYLPAFLVAGLPLVLSLWVDRRLLHGTFRTVLLRSALFGLLTATLVVALVFRTRAVWLLVGVQTVWLCVAALRARAPGPWRRLLGVYLAAALLSVALIAVVPFKLNWASETPYLDSLGSLVAPSRSSGRNHLWSFAARLIAAHPWFGVGAGQYPVVSRELVPVLSEHPEAFAFLTSDSPAFNDYLQVTVEVGLLGGALFTLVYLLLPLALLAGALSGRFRPPLPGSTWDQPEVHLVSLSLATIGLGALFANSVDRAEQVLLFSCGVGLVLRAHSEGWAPRRLSAATSLGKWALIGVALSVGTALTARYVAFPTPLTTDSQERRWGSARLAYALWPWDPYWNLPLTDYQLSAVVHFEGYDRYLSDRLQYWPGAPDAHLVVARALARQRRFVDALPHWLSAIVEVRGGQCRVPLRRSFTQFVSNAGLDLTEVLSHSGAAGCLVPFSEPEAPP